ncbi:MAG: helix-turn-helix transcriptional regulator [Candidatus Nanopelagicales bacterium]
MSELPYTPTALGRAIKRRRTEAGLTASELASAVGYADTPPVSIYRIEKGEMTPSPEKLAKIAKKLGCSAGELLALAERYTTSVASPPPRTSLAERTMYGQQSGVNAAKQQRLAETVERNQEITADLLEHFQRASDRVTADFLEPLYRTLGKVTKIPDRPAPVKASKGLTATYEHQADTVAREIVRASGQMAAATGAGVAVGATAAAAAYGATAAFAAASTGTAISTLSGAAATSATLAALGGGSLAAGGMGMAAGTMVLTGLIAAPVALAAGAFAVYKGRKWRREAQERGSELDQALEVMREMRQPLFEMWNWMEIQHELLLDVAREGASELSWLNGQVGQGVDWHELSQSHNRVQRLIDLAAATYLVMSLPVTAIVQSRSSEQVALNSDEEDDVRRWIGETTAKTRNQLDLMAYGS